MAAYLTIVLFGVLIGVILSFKNESRKNNDIIKQRLKILSEKIMTLERGEGQVKSESKVKEELKIETIEPLIKPKPVLESKPQPIVRPLPKTIKEPEIGNIPLPKQPRGKTKSNRDFEKLIGENLLNKIGITILVIGIGFFVKYAIDKDWIGEYGRVGIGILVGAALISIAHLIRKRYAAFSSVLIGGGIGVFYYTISIAYHYYDIFNQTTAFGIMTLITILAVALSVIYDKKEIAIIGLIGGFTSPFLVQGETENYVAFFTYIAILNMGMLVLSYFKKWQIILRLAYGFTILFFGGWIITNSIFRDLPTSFTLTLGTIFYLQFLSASLIYNLKHQINFNAFEFIQILSVNALFFIVGLVTLTGIDRETNQGIFTLSLAIFNLIIYAILLKRPIVDQNLKLIFIGKSISFITLAILVYFDSNYATLFWAIEAVILIWIGQETKQNLIKTTSALVIVVVTIGLAYSWTKQFHDFDAANIFDVTFIIHLSIILSYGIYLYFLKREPDETNLLVFPVSAFQTVLSSWVFFALYLTILIKLIIQLEQINFAYFAILVLWVYNLVYILAGVIYVKRKELPVFTEAALMISLFAITLYILSGNPNTVQLRNEVLSSNYNSLYFVTHFVIIITISYLLYLIRKISLKFFENVDFSRYLFVAISIIGLALASMELDHLSVFLFYENPESIVHILKHTQTEGYTTLWGVYSFILIIYGMRQKDKYMRLLALVIFAIALIKLFVFDIQNISEAGKIIAFISLGVLLLIVSFMYQKLKKLIVDGEMS